MSDVKGRHFEGEIVIWADRWYCRYGVSYRDLRTDDGRPPRLGRPFDDLSLGSAISTRNGETTALAVADASLDARAGVFAGRAPGRGVGAVGKSPALATAESLA